MTAPSTSAMSGKLATRDVKLALIRGAPDQKLTLYQLLHFIIMFLPGILVGVPVATIYHHIIARTWSPIVNVVGRPFLADIMVRLSRFIMCRATPAQARIVFNSTSAYKIERLSLGNSDWFTYVKANGTSGRWIAPPNTSRAEDDVVFYFIHGGGFVLDTGARSQSWLLALAKEMNIKRRVQFSAFCLDYKLAPEYKYPSQLIEILAGYHYLVNDLGVAPEKICICGDSAGGNLITAFLLHLARPHPKIKVPESLGPTPARPGSAFFISPFINLISHNRSRFENEPFDFIGNATTYNVSLDYIGHNDAALKKRSLSWNPLFYFRGPFKAAPKGIIKKFANFTAEDEKKMSGIELLSSPYVNPLLCDDPSWWKEAIPGEGRSMVSWGGKEILADDITHFVEALKKADLKPVEAYKPLAPHDSIMFDYSIGGLHTTHSFGIDQHYNWGLEQCANFLQDIDVLARRKKWDVRSDAKGGDMPGSKSGGAGQLPEEGESAGAEDVEESAILVDKKKDVPKDPDQAQNNAQSGRQ